MSRRSTDRAVRAGLFQRGHRLVRVARSLRRRRGRAPGSSPLVHHEGRTVLRRHDHLASPGHHRPRFRSPCPEQASPQETRAVLAPGPPPGLDQQKPRNTRPPVGCQKSAMASDQRFQAAASYSFIRPPRMGRRRILPQTGSGTGASGRGGRSCSARCGRLSVVVRRVSGEHPAQVSLAEDQHPVGELGADGQHEAFGEAVRARTPRRDLDHRDARVRQDRVERRRELPGAVADEEPIPGGAVAEVHDEVAGLLGGPGVRPDVRSRNGDSGRRPRSRAARRGVVV